ncbi:unnamed protein product [Phaeothamnion confervicola]
MATTRGALIAGVSVIALTGVFYQLQKRRRTKYEIVFVLGGPGSGKGTQCALIVERFGYVHLSAGDLLREERKSGSQVAEMIENYIREGKIVPAEVTVGLLRKAMRASGKRRFLIDGFPRNLENLTSWDTIMSPVCTVQMLLFLDCPEKVMEARLLTRGETSGRSDDNADAIRKRFHTYKDSTMPIIEHFRRLGKVRQVNSDQVVEAVFARIADHFEPFAKGGCC